MLNTRYAGRISNVIASARSKEPVVNMLGYTLIGEGLARITASIVHSSESRDNKQQVTDALKKKLRGKMEPVLGSFSSLDSDEFTDKITGIVSVVRESIAVNQDNLKGFSAIASNMFMDEEKDMWILNKTDAGDLLVRANGIEDDASLVSMMDSLCCTSSYMGTTEFRALSSMSNAVSDKVSGGDFVSYVDKLNNRVSFGYVVASVDDGSEQAKSLVLPTEGEPEVVNNVAVIAIEDPKKLPEVELSESEQMDLAVSAARGSVDVSVLLDYYKKVYARSPKFYEEFAKRVKSHAFC